MYILFFFLFILLDFGQGDSLFFLSLAPYTVHGLSWISLIFISAKCLVMPSFVSLCNPSLYNLVLTKKTEGAGGGGQGTENLCSFFSTFKHLSSFSSSNLSSQTQNYQLGQIEALESFSRGVFIDLFI